MPLHHPSLTPDPERFQTAAFFAGPVERALATRAEAARALGGTCRIRLLGADVESWRIDLGEARVDRDGEAAVDLEIVSTRPGSSRCCVGRAPSRTRARPECC